MRLYRFDKVLSKEDIELLRTNNLPIECEKNSDALWEALGKMFRVLPVEDTERISDMLQDNFTDGTHLTYNQLLFLQSYGIDWRNLDAVFEFANDKMIRSGFDDDYKINETGQMCHDILETLVDMGY